MRVGSPVLHLGRGEICAVSSDNRSFSIKYTDGTTLIYRGDVKTFSNGRNEDTNYSKAFASITDGEVLEPYKDAFGGLAERKIGYFEADLIEKIDDEEKL